jgi:ferredoxin
LTISISLALIFKKDMYFVKYGARVSLTMKIQTYFSLSKIGPSGNKCIGCGNCNKECPMDVDIKKYII